MIATDPMAESVLCIPSSRLDSLGRFQGYCNDFKYINKLFDNNQSSYSFFPRWQIESDPSYKQVVTYSIIQYGQYRDDTLFFSYTRGKAGGEDRLKRKLSIGIGGHISDSVMQLPNTKIPYPYPNSKWITRFRLEARREIDEEIIYSSTNPIHILSGIINDDSDAVGQVHVGVVYIFMCNNPDISPRESAIRDGQMVTFDSLKQNRESYESWSKIVIDSIYSISRNYK